MKSATMDPAAFAAAVQAAPNVTELLLSVVTPAERHLIRRCALVRRFNEALVNDVLRDAPTVTAKKIPFGRLTSIECVSAESGRPGWYYVAPADRIAHENAWLGQSQVADTDGLSEENFRALNGQIADWFAKAGPEGEVEEVYHRIPANIVTATIRFKQLYDAASSAFDLARCESLLAVLDSRARFLDPSLASRRTDARVELRSRSVIAHDYYRTARHFERPALVKAFSDMLTDDEHFILQLYGPGGRGKTMFLRWLAARYCLERSIPIARVDFDFLDESEAGLEPRFFFGKLAEQLNLQLRGAPFTEMLDTVREMRRAAIARRTSGRRDVARNESEEAEIEERFASVLEESLRGPVVLVFDTLEDAKLRHNVDLLAIVDAISDMRRNIDNRARLAGRTPPRVIVILSGRYTLAEQYEKVDAKYHSVVRVEEVEPFKPDEARTYLTGIRGVPASAVVEEVVRQAEGSPIRLALYADILVANPKITEGEVRGAENVDMFYLVERVLRRIPDYALRWVLRYGVVARRLTQQFLEEILGPHLERAIAGDRALDNPDKDDVRDDRWRGLWKDEDGAKSKKLNYDKLWLKLCEFASPSSWVMTDEGREVLVFQPAVTHPMRRVLRTHEVYRRVQRDAIRVLRKRIKESRIPSAADLAELTYHEFQVDAADATRRWHKRLETYSFDTDLVRALASVVVSEDLRESEAEPNEGDSVLVSKAVEARAYFALAKAAFDEAGDASTEEDQRLLADARVNLERYDKKRAGVAERVMPLVNEASLRWELADDPETRERALAQLIESEREGVPASGQRYVLETLQRAFTDTDPQQAEAYALQLVKVARREQDAMAFFEAVRSACELARKRGALATALEECQSAIDSLRPETGKWTSRKDAREELRRLKRMRGLIQSDIGLPATALRMSDPASTRAPSSIYDVYEWSDALMNKAAFELQSGDPLDSSRTLKRVAVKIDSLLRTKRAPGKARALTSRRIGCNRLQGHVARVMLSFGAALDHFQAAMALAARTEDHNGELWLRLTRARVYLHYIGDCRQAADQLVDDDGALTQESVELRFHHAILRAGLHDKRENKAEATRLIEFAERLVPDLRDDPIGDRIELAVSALSLDAIDDRLPWLEMLGDALQRLDCSPARLARLRGLRYCAAIDGVTPAAAKELIHLTNLDSAERAVGQIVGTDRLRLELHRVELLRVLGEFEHARDALLSLRQPLRKHGAGTYEREAAMACDQLGVPQDKVLRADWYTDFTRRYRAEPTLCAAVTLEEGERAFRAGTIDRAGSLAVVSLELLEHDDAIRSVYDLRCLTLHAEVAKAHDDARAAKRFETRADTLRGELGLTKRKEMLKPTSAPTASISRERFVDAGAGLIVRVFNHNDLGVTAWADPPVQMGVERVKPGGPLAPILESLAAGAVSGSGSLALIRMLRSSWRELGLALANGMFSDTLRETLRLRLDRSAQSRPPIDPVSDDLEIVIESEHAPLHGVPWELIDLGREVGTPLSIEAGARHLWRGSSDTMLATRLQWEQWAARKLLGKALGDGSSDTASLVQGELGLEVTGRFDTTTRLALRHAVRDSRDGLGPMVLLIQATADQEVRRARGLASRGTNLREIYRERGIEVIRLVEPDPEGLRTALRQAPVTVVHIATPVAESRAGSDVFLQFGSDPDRSATAFTASHLATVIKSASSRAPAPLVIVETPRPPSLDEALRQLVLRNVFAAQLFLFAQLPTVIATGLGNPDEQQFLSRILADGIARGESPGETVRALRGVERDWTSSGASPVPYGPDWVLPTACVALFAQDPNLDPQDLFGVRNA